MASSVAQEPPADHRNWAELPWDVLSVIFEKLGAFEVLFRAQAVCRPWWRLSLEPQIWRCVDLASGASDLYAEYNLELIAKEAVDRSSGQLAKFYIKDFGNDELLKYISDRTTLLRCLRLVCCFVSDDGLVDMVKKFPMLEELEVSYCPFKKETYELVGHCCPQLKSFSLNSNGYKYPHAESNQQALAIAENMPELRKLQLFGNKLTNDGLLAILDGCPNLEFLDLRQCFGVNIQGNLLKRCERVKNLRLPSDCILDYPYIAEDEFELGGDCSFDHYDYFDDYDDYLSEYSDIDLMFDDMFYDHSDDNNDAEYLFF